MTTIYLVRHSIPFKEHGGIEKTTDSILLANMKSPLSVPGEHLAEHVSLNREFDDIDAVWASSYVRTMSTAKYLANKNNLEINVISDLGERKFGIDSWNELPDKFERKQFLDENYKIGNGERQKEVSNRMYSTIIKILNENKNKRIAIVSHATAISYLLKKWCDIEIVDDKLRYSFNNNILLDGYFNYCETFKLEFDDENNLINIQNIKFD